MCSAINVIEVLDNICFPKRLLRVQRRSPNLQSLQVVIHCPDGHCAEVVAGAEGSGGGDGFGGAELKAIVVDLADDGFGEAKGFVAVVHLE